MRHYKINTYANGFGIWESEIRYIIGLGNTAPALKIIESSIKSAKRAIRREIVARNANQVKRLKYQVKANELDNSNRLWLLIITEA